jgi:hypothetical protein
MRLQLRLRLCLRWGLRRTVHILAHDAFHDAVLFCDKGVLAVVISLQAALSLGLDPALKLGACLRTYVSHAFVIFP